MQKSSLQERRLAANRAGGGAPAVLTLNLNLLQGHDLYKYRSHQVSR
jgi:hypothetical protein